MVDAYEREQQAIHDQRRREATDLMTLRAEVERLKAENTELRRILADTPDPHEVENLRRLVAEPKP